MMAKFRKVRIDFWKNPIVEEMSPEDKYFYIYLLTNHNTTQIGIYQITKKQIAYDLGYSIESVQSLMERFTLQHKLIRYNPETKELAIKNWAKDNLDRAGKPVMDCIFSELKDVQDPSLIQYIAESIQRQEIRSLYESFCKQEANEVNDFDVNDTYIDQYNETLTHRYTIGGQEEEKDKEKDKEKEEQQQVALYPNIENNQGIENRLQNNQNDVKEIVEFWDNNGFGFTNVNAKEQLLSWLEDSSFLQPKAVILKAMTIACANNKRRLNYVVGILKNWENESLLTVEEIDLYVENQKPVQKNYSSSESFKGGRVIPRGFQLDLTAGEE